jgi:hypothetical protein
MAGKVLRREVMIADTRDGDNLAKLKRGDPSALPLESMTLHPGDEVPSWAKDQIDESWYDERYESAGTNLYDDNVYQVVKRVAEEKGVEVGDDWSADQIAAAIRHHEAHQSLREEYGEDDEEVQEAVKSDQDTLAALFGDSNKAGNVNAPDQPEKPSRSRSSGSSGGSDS